MDDVMRVNEYGEIVEQVWKALPKHFSNVSLDEFVVMPNHIHGIVIIKGETDENPIRRGEAFDVEFNRTEDKSASNASPLRYDQYVVANGTKTRSVGAIVQSFKSVTTRRINQLTNTSGRTVWQRNYYERIIRNERELGTIRHYIRYNASKWSDDIYYPDNPMP